MRIQIAQAGIVALLLATGAANAAAQVERGTQLPPFDTAAVRGLEWTSIGPARGGRSIGVGGSDSRPLEYYFGATGGGLWKTTDGGTTWRAVTDGQIGSASVGAVAVCQANPDIVYIGTGETQFRGNIQPGDGLYKTTDAGKTWTHIGLREARNFSRVRVHPTDCDVVYAGAFGHYGMANPERGVYKSTDGGATWEKVLHRDERSGAVDISIDPSNPDVVYAALWEAWRKTWGMSSGGPGSGLFKSTDGGQSWTELTRNPGMPPADQVIGKIGVSVSAVDGNRVYALVEADSGGVFVSDDGGRTWTRANNERKLRQRAFYYTRIYADTEERDVVYALNTGFYKSTDGGKTFPDSLRSRVPHGDNHDLWIASNDNQRMINANDGGANVSVNGGETWTDQDYSTAQIYRLSVTHHEPPHVCGGQQDNSTVCVPTRGWEHLAARGRGAFFYAAGGCESGYVANDPRDTDIFYAGCYGGALDRFDYGTGQTRTVNIWPENPMGWSASELRQRVQWTFPIMFSPTDPNVLYATSQHVWRSTNEGQTWERISPDLTRADPSTLAASGGPITRDQTGVETYATVFALGPSPHDGDLIWAGSDDGLVHVTRNGGGDWQNVTPPDMPDFAKITTVEPSPHDPARAYVVAHRFLLDDFSPIAYRTDDYGQSWARITDGLPADEVTRSIREDIVRPGLLYLGTERGVWVSLDDGASWQPLQRNLPTVQVSDLAVLDRDLAIATHGRSFWVMYDIEPLRQYGAQVVRGPVHLYRPSYAVRGVDSGVNVYYHLSEPPDTVELEFLDLQGNLIRSFEATPADTAEADEQPSFFGGGQRPPSRNVGLNRFTWDLRHAGYTDFEGRIFWAAGNRGPVVMPGTYQVRLAAGGETRTEQFEIRLDPRLEGEVTVADLQQRFDLAMRVRDRVSEANEAVLLIRGVKEQIDDRLTRTQDAEVEQAADSVRGGLSEVEEEIYQVRLQSNQDPLNYPIKLNNKLAALLGAIESSEHRPTDAMYEVFDTLSVALDEQLTRLNDILDRDLAALNALLRENGLAPVERRPAGGERIAAPPET
ncbi:MAG: WD40/YVTN/BNR-like repeat-containing protein [Longimicrobiales bacterium]